MIYRSIRKDQWIVAYLDFQNTGPRLKLYKFKSWLNSAARQSFLKIYYSAGSAAKVSNEPLSRRALNIYLTCSILLEND